MSTIESVVELSMKPMTGQQIPSPPMSPGKSIVAPKILNSQSSYPMASLQKYQFKVNAWDNVNESGYLDRCSEFLNQYYAVRSKKDLLKKKEVKKSVGTRRKREYVSDTNSNYDSGLERVRTRRVTKEKSYGETGSDSDKGFVSSSSSSVSPKKRKTKDSNASKPIFVDWESIPDYCPPLSTLPSSTRCLATEWKGSPMDLSNDAFADKLHPAEIVLASILRLPCNVYLDSKRRLFVEKVARMKKGLPFRRTDAQKACRIDVNKASRLFASFEKAGWLDDSHFEKFL